MEELVLDTGLKKIAIKIEDGETVSVLKINVADVGTVERFAAIINNLEKISEDWDKEADAHKEKYENDGDTDEIDISRVLDISRVRVKYIRKIINEIDGLFGENTVSGIFGDMIPDETALLDFIEGVIPVMNKLFGKRFETNRKRYNSSRKGARA